MLNHDLLFSVPCCFLLDRLVKEATCNVMVDHLQSRVTPWRQYASHVKVRGTLSKMDVMDPHVQLQSIPHGKRSRYKSRDTNAARKVISRPANPCKLCQPLFVGLFKGVKQFLRSMMF